MTELKPPTPNADPIYHPAQKVTVPENASGQRVDNFLLAHLKGVPKSHIYRILRTGEVRVNGGRKKPVFKLKSGDVVRVPPIKLNAKDDINVPKRVYEQLLENIVFENDDFLVLNKPSGLAVHGGSGVLYGVIEAFKQYHTSDKPLELVHRIDRDTSGCLLLAKGRKALNALQDGFRQRDMQKTYIALLTGHLEQPQRVDQPLQKREIGGEQRVVIPTPTQAKDGTTPAKNAISTFHPIKHVNTPAGKSTLCEVVIETGRTHQIRVHAQYLGMPLAGDDKYGVGAVNKAYAKVGVGRLFLHASKLAFVFDGRSYAFESPLGEDLDGFARL